jgi:hypothetical protein
VGDTFDGPTDAWVVYDDLLEPEERLCPPANTLLITGEPESVRRYRPRFTTQFSKVWTSQASITHSHVTRRNEAQHWHYGLRAGRIHGCPMAFDDLQRIGIPDKSKLISVICSQKAHTPDHRQRLNFVAALKKALGHKLDVFGRGTREVEDKSDAIFEYQYHVVLENDHSEHFMTEKLADAFLGWSYPIYFGGREAYFRYPQGSFAAINIYEPEEAIRNVKQVIESNAFSQSLPALQKARRRVLFENNICSMLAEYWRENLDQAPIEPVRLLPKSHRASLVAKQIYRAIQQPFRYGNVFGGRAA